MSSDTQTWIECFGSTEQSAMFVPGNTCEIQELANAKFSCLLLSLPENLLSGQNHVMSHDHDQTQLGQTATEEGIESAVCAKAK